MIYNSEINTLNTTRVCGGDHFQNAIAISNVIYADKSPDSVIITNGEIIQDAIISAPMIHFPFNAPILFSHTNYVDRETINQIYKLKPKGINGTHIFLIGGISEEVSEYLKILGFGIEIITGRNYFETAANIAGYRNELDNLILISDEAYWDGLSACAWSAHMGTPILLTVKNYLPSYTREIILKAGNPNVYLFGSKDSISNEVENELKELNVNSLDRIPGDNPYEIAVNFSKYKSPDGNFGWGKTDRNGHAFTFTSVQYPFDSTSGAIFAHLGKHSPTLVIQSNKLPEITREFIESVKPEPKKEPGPPFMHGWIIGCEDEISYPVQMDIERALSIDEVELKNNV